MASVKATGANPADQELRQRNVANGAINGSLTAKPEIDNKKKQKVS
jgi:hypothetical protein